MANKNEEFMKKVGFVEGTPKPTVPPAPARTYKDNAAYDDHDSPRAPLLQHGETQF